MHKYLITIVISICYKKTFFTPQVDSVYYMWHTYGINYSALGRGVDIDDRVRWSVRRFALKGQAGAQ